MHPTTVVTLDALKTEYGEDSPEFQTALKTVINDLIGELTNGLFPAGLLPFGGVFRTRIEQASVFQSHAGNQVLRLELKIEDPHLSDLSGSSLSFFVPFTGLTNTENSNAARAARILGTITGDFSLHSIDHLSTLVGQVCYARVDYSRPDHVCMSVVKDVVSHDEWRDHVLVGINRVPMPPDVHEWLMKWRADRVLMKKV